MGEEREQRLFPDREQSDQRITCHDITSEFLIYGTDVSDWYRNISLGEIFWESGWRVVIFLNNFLPAKFQIPLAC